MKMKKIAVIGGGVAGMETAIQLNRLGYQVDLIEIEEKLGGHVRNWYKLFPDHKPAGEILEKLTSNLSASDVQIKTSVKINAFSRKGKKLCLFDEACEFGVYDAVVVTTGFDLFEAYRKEEYGFGIYKNVITSAGLELMFRDKAIKTVSGNIPKRVGLVHCVGSRDEKCGNLHCSKVCCVTAVKQAITIRQMLPTTEVFCFYMDMRMFGPAYEELYREAQEQWAVRFIRGRISEAAQNANETIQIKTEDTLTGRQLKMNVDLLVLMVGMLPSKGTTELGKKFGLEFGMNRFLKVRDEHYQSNETNQEGIFVAGSASAPMNISDTISHARAAATAVDHYLKTADHDGFTEKPDIRKLEKSLQEK